ncbi:tape measure protein [Arthrobacter phage Bumble]|uniref:Tape measure protein n=1 Tax=Arthrobacter phage Bumble TaxID=2743904 RepID=A0A7G3V9Y2_9CAUD|nr:tape measure protein [Arthrobacter phage Bumble]
MAEERVVLTAELRDEASAPLGALSKDVVTASKKVAEASTDQADAVAAAGRKINGSTAGVGRDMDAMGTAARRASRTTAGAVEDASREVAKSADKMGKAARRAGEDTGTQMASGFGSKIKGMVAGAVAAMGIRELAGMANGAVNAFSELEDASAAAGTIYGAQMDKIIADSKKAGEAFGLNESQYVAAAQSYGVYGKSAGLSGKELESFSTDLIERAGDMASFFGKSPEQAVEAIGAAMRGEAEPIRAFGVMLDDATMRNKALEMGLVKTTKDALDPQTKVLAAQALIMEKSNGVAGDFAKTQNSTANVAKRLSAAQANLSAKIGAQLAPAFTKARLKALGLVNGISGFIDRIDAAKKVAAGGGLSQNIAKALGFGPGPTKILSEGIGTVRAFRAAMADPNGGVTSDGVAGAAERLGIGIAHARMGVSAFFAALRDGDVTSDGFVGFMERIGSYLHSLSPAQWAGVAGGAGLLLASFGKLSPILSPLLGIFARFGPVLGSMGGALKFLLGPIGLISGLLLAAYMTNEPFRNSINALVPQILSLAGTLLTSLMPVFTTLVTTLLPVISSLFATLVPVIISIVGAVAPLIVQLAAQLLPLFVQLITAILPPVMGLLTMLAPIFAQLITALAPLIPPVMQIVALLLNLAMQVLTPLIPIIGIVAGILSKVLGGAIGFIMPIVKFLVEAFVNLVTFLEGPLSEAIKWVGGLFEGIGKIIGDVAKNVGDFFSNPLGGLQDMFGIPKNSGGGVYSGGGVAAFAGGGVLGGYAPGRDTIPALLSPGESVLVPELTRAIGPANIMALNRKFSGGRPAGSGPSPAVLSSSTSSGSGGGGGDVYEINVVVHGNGDPEEIKQAVREALAEAAEETRRRAYA